MQVVILCGGKGTRVSEFTENIPKPLIKVGDKPILHHLIEYYASYGFKDFIFLLGYKGEQIRDYFKNINDMNIQFVDTGENSNKAERLMKVKDIIKDDTFFLSYGDDLSDVDIKKLFEFHNENKKIVTLTATSLVSPFGILEMNDNSEVVNFKEKPKLNHFMNGGFYVINKEIFRYIKQGYDLEKEVFEDLTKENKIIAFKHDGFWKSMNTLKDVVEFNELAKQEKIPWKK